MLANDIRPNIVSYELLIERLTEDRNLEMAVFMLKDMESQELAPSAETAANIINLAATLGHPRLALDLAMAYEIDSVRPLSGEAWVRCLGSCAEFLYVRPPLYLSAPTLITGVDGRN
jgi:pentatricopeptide repeat protein